MPNQITRRAAISALAAAPAVLSLPSETSAEDQSPRTASGKGGMVISVSRDASDAGAAILEAGGNAVDAAIATAFALAVTYPQAGNIGGGGFMLVQPPGKNPLCVDYRESAPAAAKADMFAEGGDRLHHTMVGTPGTVRGLARAHLEFGSLKWADLVAPAIKLAAEGFVLDEAMAAAFMGLLASSRNEELQRVFSKPGGGRWQSGDRMVQKDLAATLTRIAEQGPLEFYEGKTADLLADEMKTGDGLITKTDLAAYETFVEPAIQTRYRDVDYFGPPPPSSGGIVVAQMLNMLEGFPLAEQGRFDPLTLHQLIETMKRAFRDRAAHLGDARFVEIPDKLIAKDYARQLAAQIKPDRATPSLELGGEIEIASEGGSTTHFSVIDNDGMAVSNTYTLEQTWGARIVVRGAGFLLNNEMGDFNWRPGHTDRHGRIGTPANTIAPGKRMLSSQTPSIISADGKPKLITGSPGGRTIINTVLCVVLNVCEFGMDLKAAVDAPRLHHGWLPDVASLEKLPADTADKAQAALRKRGHRLSMGGIQGNAHSILIDDEVHHGVADFRRYNGKASTA